MDNEHENPLVGLAKLFIEFIRELLNVQTHQTNTKLEIIMAKLEELNAKLDEQATEITAMKERIVVDAEAWKTEIQSLKDQIAAGGTITEAQLDPLLAKAQANLDSVKAVDPNPNT